MRYLLLIFIILFGINSKVHGESLQKIIKEEKDLTVSMVIFNGTFIELSDDSIWKISPEDRETAKGWIIPAHIMISDSDSQDYPYKLYNTITEKSVKASKSTKNEIDIYKEAQKARQQELLEDLKNKQLRNKY
jgi:hypothetical protein